MAGFWVVMLSGFWFVILIFFTIIFLIISGTILLLISGIIFFIIGLCNRKKNFGKVFAAIGGGILLLFLGLIISFFAVNFFSDLYLPPKETETTQNTQESISMIFLEAEDICLEEIYI